MKKVHRNLGLKKIVHLKMIYKNYFESCKVKISIFGWITATQILIHIWQLSFKYRYKFRILIIKDMS